ncbi:unnamed protein product, partial [Scytosiphon promiscuus]
NLAPAAAARDAASGHVGGTPSPGASFPSQAAGVPPGYGGGSGNSGDLSSRVVPQQIPPGPPRAGRGVLRESSPNNEARHSGLGSSGGSRSCATASDRHNRVVGTGVEGGF